MAVTLLVALFASGAGLSADASARSDPDAKRGVRLDGLHRTSKAHKCRGNYALEARGAAGTQCSHGPDPAPKGVDVTDRPTTAELRSDAQWVTAAALATPAVPCYGDGTSGTRVQAIYARSADVPDRYASVSALVPGWAGQADNVFAQSAAEAGGSRHVRWVTGAGCALSVANVVLSSTGDDSLSNTISELAAKGYNRTDRKYLVWSDATRYCGIGTINNDDRPTPDNANNRGASYARVDAACWGSVMSVEAHELMHNLGGVQLSAPNATTGFHCSDESDRMCYSDDVSVTLRYICPSTNEALFDCGDDDYYSAAPAAGSYLATHWNAANSVYLSSAPPDAWGSTPTPIVTPAPLITTTYSGSFTSTTTTRRYNVASGAGVLTARATNSKRLWTTVSIRRTDGTLIAKRSAYSPATVSATLPAGTYSIGVSAKPSSFTLAVTRPRP